MGVSAAITVTMRRSIRLCWRLTGTTFLRRVRTGGKTPRQAENLHDYADREFDYYKTGAELTLERAESDGWTVGQDEERLDDCPLIVLAVSLAAGPRSLQLDTHGANLALRAGKYVEAVPETGPAPAVVAATGSTFADTTSGEFGARFAVSPDEPICDGGAYYSDQSDAHDHDDRRPRGGGGGDDGPPDRVAEGGDGCAGRVVFHASPEKGADKHDSDHDGHDRPGDLFRAHRREAMTQDR